MSRKRKKKRKRRLTQIKGGTKKTKKERRYNKYKVTGRFEVCGLRDSNRNILLLSLPLKKI